MKAVSADLPPDGTGWAYELKWDGMRVLAALVDGHVRLTSGNGLDATVRFPELAGLGAAVGVDAVLDGEVVALDERGRPDFGRLQHRMHIAAAAEAARKAVESPVTYAVFDVLHLAGHDTCPLPYLDRRRLVADLVATAPRWRVPGHHDDGAALYEAARDGGLEGVMAKKVDSPYLPGKRSPTWRKVKIRRRQELVVAGWWPGEGARDGRLGSLLVGVHEPDPDGGPGRLRYAGRVGTGFTAAELDRLGGLLAPLALDRCPFDPPPPRPVARVAHWARPELVVEVAFAEWTADGVLRHPSYLGERTDKDPTEVVHEPG
jgi:bifunctional non-homologous end joining protein LigD